MFAEKFVQEAPNALVRQLEGGRLQTHRKS
jgi:hypothetical protein